MIDLKKYLESGVIEAYCLGMASQAEATELEKLCKENEEIRKHLEATQQLLEQYLAAFKKEVPADAKEKILQSVEDALLKEVQWSEKRFRMDRFIGISERSDVRKWQQMVEQIEVNTAYDNIYLHPLFADEHRQLLLAWVKKEIPPEKHHDLEESFLVLEGTCNCIVGEETFELQAGSFMQMPLNVYHRVEVTSGKPVKAILSQVKIAC